MADNLYHKVDDLVKEVNPSDLGTLNSSMINFKRSENPTVLALNANLINSYYLSLSNNGLKTMNVDQYN